MRLAEWINFKLTPFDRFVGARYSLRYDSFYINIRVVNTLLHFSSFKEYYDKHLKGKVVKFPFGEIQMNPLEGEREFRNINRIRLGGIKLHSSISNMFQLTLWFPDIDK